TPPKVHVEGVGALWQQLASATSSDPNAKKIAAQNTAEPAASQPTTAPAGPSDKASEKPAAVVPAKSAPKASKADRIKALPDDERQWLTEFVAPIILPEEESVFLDLHHPYHPHEFNPPFCERRHARN